VIVTWILVCFRWFMHSCERFQPLVRSYRGADLPY
jgi:hypothetical protein